MSDLPDLDSGAVILRLSDRIKDQADRIEALEAALREIALWDDNGDQICRDIARAALEQDK
jgi:hypothetical protein